MKKFIQRFLSIALTLAMLSGVIVMPSFAAEATEPTVVYQTDFQTHTAGETYTIYNNFPDLGRAADMWYADSAGVAASAKATNTDGIDRDPIRFIDRGNGDIAVRMGTSKAYTIDYYTQANILPKIGVNAVLSDGDGDVLRIKTDMMAEDKNNDKLFGIRFGDDTTVHPIINLDNDGYIYVWGTKLDAYDVNTWYAFDIYLDFDSKLVYVYINDTLKTILKETSYITTNGVGITYLQLTSTVSAGTTGGMCFDNIEISDMEKSHIPSNRGEAGKFVGVDSLNWTSSPTTGNIRGTNFSSGTYNNSSKGLYGKTNDDASLNMTPTNSENFVDVMFYKERGYVYHFSTLLSIPDDSSATAVKKFIFRGGNEVLKITNKVVTLGQGTTVLATLDTGRWYRFDVVITFSTTESNRANADIYINGEKKGTAERVFLNATHSSADRLRILVPAGDKLFIDDSSLVVYNLGDNPVIPAVTLTGNPDVEVSDFEAVIAPENYIVSDFNNNTVSSMPYEIRTKAGATVADNASLVGNFVVFKPAIGGEIYYEVKAARDASYNFKSTYDRTNDDALTLTGGTSEIKEAGYGRDTNANYVTIDDSGIAKLESSFYGTLCQTAEGNTLEMDIKTPSDGASIEVYVSFTSGGKQSNRKPMLKFEKDGKILLVNYNNSDDIADATITDTGRTWEPNRWYHLGIHLHASRGAGYVYLNGNLVGESLTVTSNKNISVFGIYATGAGSTFALDNIMAYDGNYESVAVQDKVVYGSRLADNKNRVIYLPGSFVGQVPWSYFDENVVIYKDSTLNEQIEATADYILTGNENIIVTSPSGKSIGYYTVDSEDNAEIFGIKQNGVYVTGGDVPSDGGVLSVKVYNEASYIIIAAQYDINGEMVSLATSEDGHDEIVNIGIDDEASEIKFMCMDSLGTIKPLKLAKVLGVSRTTEE